MSLNAAEVTATVTPGSITTLLTVLAGPPGLSRSAPQLMSPEVTPTNTSITPIQQALVWTFLAIIKEHQKGNIMHAQAMVQVSGVLPNDKFGTKAFISYVKQLSQTEQDCLMAVTGGTTAPPAPSITTPTPSMATTLSALSNLPVGVQPSMSTQAVTSLK